MKAPASDKLNEMAVFVKVAESKNFSTVAAQLGMTPSSISKVISRLEARLRVRLVNRTTRQVNLTDEGKLYYQRATRILAEIEETESLIWSNQHLPRGRVRLTCSAPFAYHQLIPIFSELNLLNPHIEITLFSTDQVVDLLEEHCDIAIRIGPLEDSTLISRKLAETKRLLVASPAYLERFGRPTHPNQLKDHHCLNFHTHSHLNKWPLQKSSTKFNWEVKQGFGADDGESLRILALTSVGIARLSAFMIADDVKKKTLVPILEAWNPGDTYPIYLLHLGHVTARVKFVIDFIFSKLGGKYFK